MTKQEFLNNFYLQMDKLASQALPGYEPSEISAMATEAQELLVVTYYTGNNSSDKSFEQTEKRIQDLGELVAHKILTPLSYNPLLNMPNGVFVELPNTLLTNPTDYSDVHWFTIYEEVLTNDKCKPRKYVLEINHNEYIRALDNPYNKPNDNKVWRMRIEGRRHELITNGNYNIQSYIFRYIKKPNPINLTVNLNDQVSQLSDHIHRELVRKTVEIAVKDIEAYNRMQAEQATNNTYRE
jgi:hypothetical protein